MQTVIQTIQLGVPIARIGLLDPLAIKTINLYGKTTLNEAPTGFEFRQYKLSQRAGRNCSKSPTKWAEPISMGNRPEDRTRLWQAQHDAYFACLLKPGSRAGSTPVSAYPFRVAECIAAASEDIAEDRFCQFRFSRSCRRW